MAFELKSCLGMKLYHIDVLMFIAALAFLSNTEIILNVLHFCEAEASTTIQILTQWACSDIVGHHRRSSDIVGHNRNPALRETDETRF